MWRYSFPGVYGRSVTSASSTTRTARCLEEGDQWVTTGFMAFSVFVVAAMSL
jgi:hypothetical protein